MALPSNWNSSTPSDFSGARASWIRDPDFAGTWLNVDHDGNLCVKLIGSPTSGCGGDFFLIEFVLATEIDLSTVLPANADAWVLHNTKADTKFDLRLANVVGNALGSVEPFLELSWGCIYESTGNCPLFVASDFAGHKAILEVIA